MNTFHVFRFVSFMTLLFVMTNVSLSQGLYWESITSDGRDEVPQTSRSYYMPGKFKMQSGEHSAVIRMDKGIILIVDPKKKEYSEMTFAQMEGAMKSAEGMMDAHMEELKKQMADLPEEQQRAMRQMMNMPKKNSEAFQVKKTGEKKSISGYTCTKHLVTHGEKQYVVWTTNDIKGLEGMKKELAEFSQRMAWILKQGDMEKTLESIEGFPMEHELGGRVMTVTKIDHRSTPASEFEAPPGYKKVKFPMPDMMEE